VIDQVADPLHQRQRMRLLLASCALILVGCAGRYRTEFVGTGNALVTTRGGAPQSQTDSVAAPGAGGIELPRGSYDFAIRFDIPRAQIIQWRASCPGVELEGAVGETYDAYRTRRIAELRELLERDRRRAAMVTNVLVGSVAPRGRVRVVTPLGTAVVHGRAPDDAVGEAVAVEPALELSPGDTGRGTLGARIRVTTTGPGVCAITAVADDADLRASFQVTRVRDLDAEAREQQATRTTGAIDARARVSSQLVVWGADAAARQRRFEAEARQRAEAEARAGAGARVRAEAELRVTSEANLRAEAEAHAEAERVRIRAEAEARARWESGAPARARAELVTRHRTIAYTTREHLIAWLVTECRADPGRRARLEEAARIERVERDRQIALRIEAVAAARFRIRAERDAQLAARVELEQARAAREAALIIELEQRRTDHALRVRSEVSGYLVSLGARLRPPRPEVIAEEPGLAPFPGATWSAGHWSWTGGQWIWTAGGWSDPDTFGETGGEVIVDVGRGSIPGGGGYSSGYTGGRGRIVRDAPPIIRRRAPAPPVVRDHRDRMPALPVVRDNHDRTPVVRDHRRKETTTRDKEPQQDDKQVRDRRR